MSDLPIFIMNQHAINAGDMSANIPAFLLDLAEVNGFAVDFIYSGSPVGNLIIAGSNQATDLTKFSQLSSTAVAAAGTTLINAADIHYRYITVSYNFTSGSGTLDCYVSGKRS